MAAPPAEAAPPPAVRLSCVGGLASLVESTPLKRSLSHVWVYVYVRTAARGWARCHCGEAVQRSEALAVWSGVDRTTYLTKAEIRHSFNVVHTAENH